MTFPVPEVFSRPEKAPAKLFLAPVKFLLPAKNQLK